MTEKQKRRINEWRKRCKARQKLPAIEDRPYLIPFLVKLGVLEDYAKTFTVGRAYDVIIKLLSKQMDSKYLVSDVFYWLWANGIPICHLKTLDQKQANEMWKLIKPKGFNGRPIKMENKNG